MAQKVIVELVDDLDGTMSDDISTVSFNLDGVDYEIDLTDANANKLRDELADFVAVARWTGGRIKRGTSAPRSAGTTRPAADREKTRAIRAWALESGYDLAERGRIPSNVIAAYEEAQVATKPKARRSRKTTTKLATD
jgi:nucleoid-associated protein Lsr2